MPIQRRNATILTSTGNEMNATGLSVKADSYYGYTDGFHTIQAVYDNFVGRFRIQATLSLDPTEADWFDINLNANRNVSSSSPYVQFPLNPADPSGQIGDDTTMAFTFVGNFVYLRVVLDRSYIIEPGELAAVTNLGNIDRVLLSM